jgi:FixJ family two-component response regulator
MEEANGSAADATVLIVDDDAAVRNSVARLVRAAGYAAKAFPVPAEFLEQPLPQGPACLVLDFQMDGMNGLEVQQALANNPRRRLPIVFLSGQGSIKTATEALKKGADDFIEKPFQSNRLLEAVRHALELDRQALSDQEDRDEVTHCNDQLTGREREVMGLVVRGKLNKQVAADLGISEKTVKVHRGRVMEKMQVDSLAELVRLAERVDYASVKAAAEEGVAEGEL